MSFEDKDKLMHGIFITFSGNCREALTFYQACFGGILHFEILDKELSGYTVPPIISGSLVSERIIIHGSDLVHDEGRRIGNYISIFLPCSGIDDRRMLREKLEAQQKVSFANDDEQRLIEVSDIFDVRWVLGV